MNKANSAQKSQPQIEGELWASLRDAHLGWLALHPPRVIPYSEFEYEDRMREFYRDVSEVVLPKWKRCVSEKQISRILLEYAKDDWVRQGFSAESFDGKLDHQKSAAFKTTVISVVIGAMFTIARIVLDAMNVDYSGTLFMGLLVVVVVVIAVNHYRLESGGSTTISLKDD